MIYLDASVALAQLFAVDRQPSEDLWREPLTASRALDALHLATMAFLRSHGQPIELASYDARLLAAARALQIPTRRL